jgi:hypothetical protein
MKRFERASIVAAAAMALALASTVASAEGTADDTDLAACGHVSEMQEARRALAEGDKERAIEHLRAARAQLVECETRSRALDSPEPADPGLSI